ncbi:formylglycine-generating enzyme family protein [bacterium]|nr:formylglycine-generating enzyme family protein [bacterium]
MEKIVCFGLGIMLFIGLTECSKSPSGPDGPAKPNLLAPAMDTTLTDITLVFDWSDMKNAVIYELMVDNNADFKSPELLSDTLTQSSCRITAPLPDNCYYWRVRGIDDHENPGQWSEIRSFYVDIMIFIEGGTFQMGDTDGSGDTDELPVHFVSVQSYEMLKYEVTQELWQSVVGNYPSSFTGNLNRPVEQVSWLNAVEFCNMLSRKHQFTPCYMIQENNVNCDFDADGYRLPTEAEWEYAARGGTQNIENLYSGSSQIGAVSWYAANSDSKTHETGLKMPNELGLFDMSGNVCEWCWDWYSEYGSTALTDPAGPLSGVYRVLRGGSWFFSERGCRCASRFRNAPDVGLSHVGFRIVRSH